MTLFALACAAAGCGGGGGGSETSTLPGTLDSSYGTGGRVPVEQGFNGFVIDRAGNVFVGGATLLKYDSSGRADAGFVDGAPTAPALSRVMAVDGSGNVYALQFVAGAPFLTKRDSRGQLVASFGQGGLVDLNAVRATVSVQRMFVDGAGNAYVQASWHPPASARPVIHFLMKLDANGRPVSAFGARGDATLELPSNFDFAAPGVTVDAAGNVYSTVPSSGADAVVAAFDANGQRMTGFRSTPVATPCVQWHLRTPLVETDSAGNIYVGTSCGVPREVVMVAKLDATGNPVTAFGNGGVAADFVTAGPGATALAALKPSADGAVYVAVYDPANECGGMVIGKLGGDGKLSDSFGEHGVTRLDLAVAVSMAVDASGRLYLAGRDRPTVCPRLLGTQISFSVYRLNG